MANYSYHLKDSKAEAETPIRMHINYSGNRVKVYIGEKIHPKHWSKARQRAKQTQEFNEYPEFNAKLDNLINKASTAFRKYQNDNDQKEPSPAHLRKLVQIAIGRKDAEPEKMDFFAYYESLIRNQKIRCDLEGRDYRDSIVKQYERNYDLLKEFSKIRRVDFDSINKDFYYSFLQFLKKKEFMTNSIGNHVKRLKSVLNSATEEGYNKNLIFRSKEFKVISEEVDNIYLTEQELGVLADLELTPGLSRSRDLFLLGAWSGLRISDFKRLSSETLDFDKQVIRIKMKKTKNPLIVPFLPEFARVINQYKESGIPVISNQKFNDNLKRIGSKLSEKNKELGINGELNDKDYSKLTSHTARRSFCSNMYYRGIDVELIMAMSGHKTRKEFFKYIKVTPDDKADRFREAFEQTNPVINLKAV